MTCAPARASAIAAARPMPREAPVTRAIRPWRDGFWPGCMNRFLGDVRQQRQLPRAAADIGQRDGIVAGETGVAEFRRGGGALFLAHGAVEPVHRNESQAV